MAIPGEMLKAGWGVIRLKPWHLAGVFVSSGDAEALAQTLGAEYVVKFGEHRVGSPVFTFSTETEV